MFMADYISTTKQTILVKAKVEASVCHV